MRDAQDRVGELEAELDEMEDDSADGADSLNAQKSSRPMRNETGPLPKPSTALSGRCFSAVKRAMSAAERSLGDSDFDDVEDAEAAVHDTPGVGQRLSRIGIHSSATGPTSRRNLSASRLEVSSAPSAGLFISLQRTE